MPIDASIPLQVRNPKFMTPAEGISLRDMVTQNQMRQAQLDYLPEQQRQQREQFDLNKQNVLSEIQARKSAADTKRLEALKGLSNEANLAFVNAYWLNMDKGDEYATKAGREAMTKAMLNQRDTGLLANYGLTDQQIDQGLQMASQADFNTIAPKTLDLAGVKELMAQREERAAYAPTTQPQQGVPLSDVPQIGTATANIIEGTPQEPGVENVQIGQSGTVLGKQPEQAAKPWDEMRARADQLEAQGGKARFERANKLRDQADKLEDNDREERKLQAQTDAKFGASIITIEGDKKTADSLAKPIGDKLVETQSAAEGAIDTMNTVNTLEDAIDSGNIAVGPGANIRQVMGRIANVLGIQGASGEEQLVNTRNAISSLARLTLDSRKSLKGQGQVSDNEQKLLERAVSGSIEDFTLPELRSFLDITARIAGKTYARHMRNLNALDQVPSGKQFRPFYDVPDLPLSRAEQKRLQELRNKK